MKKLSFLALCCCTILMLQCKPSGPDADMLKAEEEAIRNADMEWSNSAKQVDGHLSFFTEDAMVLAPNEASVSGKEAIGKILDEYHAMPGFSITWSPSDVEVASSGDLGYSIGTYNLSINDSLGSPMTDRGKYLTVWKKQADGTWKVAVDMFNSDLPAH